METIHADMTVSVTELKRNFAGILASAQGNPVAVLNHNRKPTLFPLGITNSF
jgi:antitoxin StbD